MRRLTLLASGLVGRSRLATRLAWRLSPDIFGLLGGKPYDRKLLVYDLPGQKVALANERTLVETVLHNKLERFPKSELLHAMLAPLIGDGLFSAPGGTRARAARRMFIRAIAEIPDTEIADVSRAVTREYCDRWAAAEQGFSVPTELSKLTVDIVSEAMLGTRFTPAEMSRFVRLFFDYNDRASPVVMLMTREPRRQASAVVTQLGLHPLGAELRDLMRQRFVAPLVAGDPAVSGSYFARSLRASGALDGLADSPSRQGAVLDEVAVMLLAGHETTAAAISWLLLALGRDQGLQGEVAATLRNGEARSDGRFAGHKPDAIFDALALEIMRLYPPIAFFIRDIEEDIELRGKRLPARSMIVVSPWALHRHRRAWREADIFRPERWLGGPEATPDAPYLPFGYGARACPGKQFATIEMRIMIGEILSRGRIALVGRPAPQPLGHLTSRPSVDFFATIRPHPPAERDPSGGAGGQAVVGR